VSKAARQCESASVTKSALGLEQPGGCAGGIARVRATAMGRADSTGARGAPAALGQRRRARRCRIFFQDVRKRPAGPARWCPGGPTDGA